MVVTPIRSKCTERCLQPYLTRGEEQYAIVIRYPSYSGLTRFGCGLGLALSERPVTILTKMQPLRVYDLPDRTLMADFPNELLFHALARLARKGTVIADANAADLIQEFLVSEWPGIVSRLGNRVQN